jgi:hypothetical protein
LLYLNLMNARVCKNTLERSNRARVKRKLGVKLGHNKTYRLKKQIMFDHPKMFEEPPAENVNTIK